MEEERTGYGARRRLRAREALILCLLLLMAGGGYVWTQRAFIADSAIRDQLESYGVRAQYDAPEIGFQQQVIRNLVLGDPAKPDLTAQQITVGLSVGISGVSVDWVDAQGVKLYGRLADGTLSFGEVDKFSDPTDKSPLKLPDLWLAVQSGQARIETPYGAVGLALNGSGNLRSGFNGKLGALANQTALGSCTLDRVSYYGEVRIRAEQLALKGPLRLARLDCDGANIAANDIAGSFDVRLARDFRSWNGNLGAIGGPLLLAGNKAQELRGRFAFSGDFIRTQGTADVTLSGLTSIYGGAASLSFTGDLSADYGGPKLAVAVNGTPTLAHARLARNIADRLSDSAASMAENPLRPVLAKLGAAVDAASADFTLTANLDAKSVGGAFEAKVAMLRLKSRSGARLNVDKPVDIAWTDGLPRIAADSPLSLSGGGFPVMRVNLAAKDLGEGFAGRIIMADYVADGARLALPDLRFASSRSGVRFAGGIILSGPLPDGRIDGLRLPVDGMIDRTGITALPQCVTASFARLELGSLTTGSTQLRLCPDGVRAILLQNGGQTRVAFRMAGLNLAGKVGSAPLDVATGPLIFSLQSGLRAQDVNVAIGGAGNRARFSATRFIAAFAEQIGGRFEGGEGTIANVPLLLEAIDGDWSYAAGKLTAGGMLKLRDAEPVERFKPMVVTDAAFTLANNRISATGTLREPLTARAVSAVDISHNLGNSSGQAVLTVKDLNFDNALQPEMLTPLTLGVVANVFGRVDGEGRIDWTTKGVTSTGLFRTDSLNLAAAFGPVEGLSGEIRFSDLLGLETGPDQKLALKSVNPGVAVLDGLVRYRLLPDRRVAVEGGRWPFAGGELILQPTILDMAENRARQLVFEVQGVEAAKFLKNFDFENISATGIFDGRLPMIFDADGGRIEGGYLVAREGGGSLAYVGELTYEDLGTFGNFTFSMLKSLKYRQLTIGMNGDIAGEIITNLNFSGLAQGDDIKRNIITRQLAKLPIEFNVTITAPFMQLMSSAKAYYDPSILIKQNLPALLRQQDGQAPSGTTSIPATESGAKP